MSRNRTKLREGFSAFVNTTEQQVQNTLSGQVLSPVQVFVKSGGVLPDNLVDGEVERLAEIGAFTDPPPIEKRVQGVIANNPAMLHATAPEGEAITTPSDIRAEAGGDEDEHEEPGEHPEPSPHPAGSNAAKKSTAKKATAKKAAGSVHGR